MNASSRSMAAALLLVALGSCAEEAPSWRPCDSSAECDDGEVCFEDGCGSPLDFAVRVSPLGGGEAVTEDFGSVSVAMDSVQLGLRKPGTITGVASVRRDGSASAYTGPYVLQARGRSSAIPGLDFDQPLSKLIKNGDPFSLSVPAWIWDVSATAADVAIPPVYSQKRVGSGSQVEPELVMVVGSTHVAELRARVVKASALEWGALAPTLRVQAIEKHSRIPLSQPVVFLASEEFRLWSAKTSGATALRVSADASSAIPAPTKEFDPVDGQFPGTLALGDYGEPITVVGSVVAETGEKLAGAEVRAEGTVRGGGHFTATGRTDADGVFTLQLFATEQAQGVVPAAAYVISAQPTPTSAFATASIEAQVEGSKTLAPIVCRPKRTLRGVVTVLAGPPAKEGQTPAEVPLANALIHYEGNPAAADPGPPKGDARTDDTGFFSVDVEPGSYRIVAKPATDRRLPWATRRVHTSESFVAITVPAPREVVGVLSDWNGKPVSSAIVTLFRVPSESTDTPTTPEMVYEALTDSAGVFKVVVPKAPESDD